MTSDHDLMHAAIQAKVAADAAARAALDYWVEALRQNPSMDRLQAWVHILDGLRSVAGDSAEQHEVTNMQLLGASLLLGLADLEARAANVSG